MASFDSALDCFALHAMTGDNVPNEDNLHNHEDYLHFSEYFLHDYEN